MKKQLLLSLLALGLCHGVWAVWTPKSDKIMTRWGKQVTPENTWREYPRPQLKRTSWTNLNGMWQYAVTPASATAAPKQFDGDILVPFPAESALSGVARSVLPDQILWYKREFTVDKAWRGRDIILHFGAVDFESTVWVNGKLAGTHKGGSDAFSYNITRLLKPSGPQQLLVAVKDPTCAGDQARGKQQLDPQGIWYTPVTGIWQTVWLEPLTRRHIAGVVPTTEIDSRKVTLRSDFAGLTGGERVAVRVYMGGDNVADFEFGAAEPITFTLPAAQLWSPETPYLYHFDMTLLRGGKTEDKVSSYLAFRKVGQVKDEFGRNRFALNDRILFQYGTLDQGWWPDGLLTPPSAEAMLWDMEMLKHMGFNTIRKHIKVEPALYYYYADSLGLMLWQDMPSGFAVAEKAQSHVQHNAPADWNRPVESARQWESELKTMIDHLSFFPSIVSWVVFNEGWGQYETDRVVKWTMKYAPDRIINGVSGWTDRKVGHTYDIHNYPLTAMNPMGTIEGRMQVLGEFGGLGLPVEGHLWNASMRNWGYKNYSQGATLISDYLRLLYDLEPQIQLGLSGAIYTQTTDVEGEVNGLITYDREVVKIPVSLLHMAHSRLYAARPAKEQILVADTRIAPNKKPVAVGKSLTDAVEYDMLLMPLNLDDQTKACSKAEFQLEKVPESLLLFLNMRDKIRVYLNGTLVYEREDLRLTRSYNSLNLSDYVAYLKVGKNVLEIESEALKPGSVFDYSLYAF